MVEWLGDGVSGWNSLLRAPFFMLGCAFVAVDAALPAFAAGGAAHTGAGGLAVLLEQFLEAGDVVLAIGLLGVEEDRALGEAEGEGGFVDRAAGEEEPLDLRATL